MSQKSHKIADKPAVSAGEFFMGVASVGTIVTAMLWKPVIEPILTNAEATITAVTSTPVAPEPYCTLEANKYTSRVSIYERVKENDGGYRLHQSSGPLALESDKSVRLVPGLTGTFIAHNNRTHIYREAALFPDSDVPPVSDYSSAEGTKLVITGWEKLDGKDVPVGSCSKTGVNIKGTIWESMPLRGPSVNALG